jgi:hypothetical protein
MKSIRIMQYLQTTSPVFFLAYLAVTQPPVTLAFRLLSPTLAHLLSYVHQKYPNTADKLIS